MTWWNYWPSFHRISLCLLVWEGLNSKLAYTKKVGSVVLYPKYLVQLEAALIRVEMLSFIGLGTSGFCEEHKSQSALYQWFSARLQYLHCISNGDSAVLQ